MRGSPRLHNLLLSLVLTVGLEGLGILAFLSSIHGPASGFLFASVAFPVVGILLHAQPQLVENMAVYVTSVILGFALWATGIYTALEWLRSRGEYR